MHVEQRECQEEKPRRRDEFEVAQEERFRLVHEHMTSQDNNSNNFATYATKKFNQIRQDMGFNNGATKNDINNMIFYQNENQHHYQQFSGRCVIFGCQI